MLSNCDCSLSPVNAGWIGQTLSGLSSSGGHMIVSITGCSSQQQEQLEGCFQDSAKLFHYDDNRRSDYCRLKKTDCLYHIEDGDNVSNHSGVAHSSATPSPVKSRGHSRGGRRPAKSHGHDARNHTSSDNDKPSPWNYQSYAACTRQAGREHSTSMSKASSEYSNSLQNCLNSENQGDTWNYGEYGNCLSQAINKYTASIDNASTEYSQNLARCDTL